MAAQGSLSPASIHGTWVETVEVWDMVNDAPLDLSSLIEIILQLRWPQMGPAQLGYAEVILKMTQGQIVTVPDQGIIQWRAEVGLMGTLTSGLYEVILLLKDDTGDTVPLIIGTISIVG